jgi:hypothetical protein
MNDEAPLPYHRVGDEWMVLGITLAVTEHRRRIAHLLGRLDELCCDAGLRAGDAQLSLLVHELERQRRSCTIQEVRR